MGEQTEAKVEEGSEVPIEEEQPGAPTVPGQPEPDRPEAFKDQQPPENAQYSPPGESRVLGTAQEQQPTVGRIVHYTLDRKDAEHANRRRTTTKSIADRSNAGTWALGAQAHIGNEHREGQVLPMIVVAIFQPGDPQGIVNGQVFLDGNDQLWVTSAHKGTGPGTWAWPARA